VVKRAEMMRKEWWKLKSIKATINDIISLGVLQNWELAGWWAATATPIPSLEHFSWRLVQEVVLHPRRARQRYVVRRRVHSRQESGLERATRAGRAGGGVDGAAPVESPGRTGRGRELH
jgi:hypothetical protein